MQDIYNWILRIIETCNNTFHFEAVDKLIDLFYDKYKDEKLTEDLKLRRTRMWNEIHNVIV